MDFNARQYDPQIGRFLRVDPMAASGNQDMFSPYAAMGDNPAGNVDPGGMGFGPPPIVPFVTSVPTFSSPSLNGLGGGLMWMPMGDAGAAFGQANMDYYGQKILEDQDKTKGDNGNNSGNGSVVNNGGTSSGNSNNDGGCTSMTTDYHGGNGNSGDNGTGGLPWYEDWNGGSTASAAGALAETGALAEAAAAELTEMLKGLGIAIDVTAASLLSGVATGAAVLLPKEIGEGTLPQDLPANIKDLGKNGFGNSKHWTETVPDPATDFNRINSRFNNDMNKFNREQFPDSKGFKRWLFISIGVYELYDNNQTFYDNLPHTSTPSFNPGYYNGVHPEE